MMCCHLCVWRGRAGAGEWRTSPPPPPPSTHQPPHTQRVHPGYTTQHQHTTTSCCSCLLILAALDIFRTEQVLIWLVWERCGSVGQMGQRADLEYHNNDNAGCGVWGSVDRGVSSPSFVDTKLRGKYVDQNNNCVILGITASQLHSFTT